MIQVIKEDCKVIKDGKPGRRFRNFRDYKRSQQGSFYALLAVWIVGILLIVVGLAISWIPGPGGFLSIVGVAMIAPWVPGVPYILDWSEVTSRRFFHRLKKRS